MLYNFNDMARDKFLLVSLKENKAKELAQVISNESCRKILDYLADKQDATESELAEKLNIPISTVHYNMKHLVKGGLVTADEFHYSEKGREVDHYKLANKYIIIAPKSTYGIKEKLKSILPVALLGLIGAGFIHAYSKYFRPVATFGAAKMAAVPSVMEQAVEDAVPTASEALIGALRDEGANAVMEKVPEVVTTAVQAAPNYALWFLFGCIFVIVLIVIFDLIRAKREK